MKCEQVFRGHDGAVHIALFDSKSQLSIHRSLESGEYILSGGQDKQLLLHSRKSSTPLASYEGHGWPILSLSISPDAERIASAGEDRQIFLWDSSTRKLLRRLSGHTQRIDALSFHRSSSDNTFLLASAGYDRSIRLWDLRSSERFPLQVLEDAKDGVTSLDWRDYFLLASSVDGHVRCYDIRKSLLTTDAIGAPVTSVQFSNLLRNYLVSSLDGKIRLLENSSGKILCEYSGHKAGQYKCSVTYLQPEERLLAFGSENGPIHIWDLVPKGRGIISLPGHTGPVTSVTSHPTRPELISSSLDGTVRLWS